MGWKLDAMHHETALESEQRSDVSLRETRQNSGFDSHIDGVWNSLVEAMLGILQNIYSGFEGRKRSSHISPFLSRDWISNSTYSPRDETLNCKDSESVVGIPDLPSLMENWQWCGN